MLGKREPEGKKANAKTRDAEVKIKGPLPKLEHGRSMVLPISRIWFELTDKNAFERSIHYCINWMEENPRRSLLPRSGVKLPAEAHAGGTFDISDTLGANPTRAVRIEAKDGILWAARLDWPDPQAPRSWVSEFFVHRRPGLTTRFGAQLTCVRRGECPPIALSRPTVVRTILENLSAEADGRPLRDIIETTSRAEINEFVDLLYSPKRRLPIVALSEPDDGYSGYDISKFSRNLGGAAHIVYLDHDASWELTRCVGKRMSVFGGAARLYQPGLSEDEEDSFAHPLWLPNQHQEGFILRQLSNRVLPAAFFGKSESTFLRYADVREAGTHLSRQSHSTSNISKEKILHIVAEKTKILEDDRDLWRGLAEEQDAARMVAESEVERLKAEIARLEYKYASLEYILEHRHEPQEEKKADRRLASYDDLEDWAQEVLGESVFIHSAALKDCRKNGHPNMLERIESALLIIRDYLSPWRITGDTNYRDKGREKLGELGFEDSACFVDRDEAKKRPQYSVPHVGETRVLYDHLKYGNGYNNANQIRIYYFWDSEKKQFVIGKMPSHLPNHKTN